MTDDFGMRFIVYGAGGVGGVVGARLAQDGHDVVLIARGAHYEAIRGAGLRIESPDAVATLHLPVFNRPDQLSLSTRDIVLLAMKSQDTLLALDLLAAVAPAETPIVCMQNGVANERMAMYATHFRMSGSLIRNAIVKGPAPLRKAKSEAKGKAFMGVTALAESQASHVL